jgi:hypothetical protein
VSGVFIASLGHSGSTLLDLMLGSHPRLVSLGEVHATIARAAEKQNVCTCGKAAEECPIWGPVLAATRQDPRRPYGELDALVQERVRAVCGDGVAPVDSSKHVPALAALPDERRRALRVVFLVKDVRSFVASAVDRSLPWTKRLRNTTPWSGRAGAAATAASRSTSHARGSRRSRSGTGALLQVGGGDAEAPRVPGRPGSTAVPAPRGGERPTSCAATECASTGEASAVATTRAG